MNAEPLLGQLAVHMHRHAGDHVFIGHATDRHLLKAGFRFQGQLIADFQTNFLGQDAADDYLPLDELLENALAIATN